MEKPFRRRILGGKRSLFDLLHLIQINLNRHLTAQEHLYLDRQLAADGINVLNNAGAKKVIVVATHGILSDPAAKRLSESGAAEVVVTDTLPIPAEKRFDQLTVLSIAPLLARAIREVFEDGSVTSLFN